MRLPFATFASAATLAIAGAASADFMNFEVERITLGNGHIIMNVYAKFSNSGDRVLNVFRSNISTTNASGFHQSGGNPFWNAGTTQNKNTADDSFLLVGANPLLNNGQAGGGVDPDGGGPLGPLGPSVTADPNFANWNDEGGASDFSYIASTGNGAGWYNGNPQNAYGYAFDNGRVLLAHFVATDATTDDYVSWYARLTITRPGVAGSSEIDVEGQNFLWIIPTPGAFALLGLAGLASRRRRA